jgi:hypothetical protein
MVGTCSPRSLPLALLTATRTDGGLDADGATGRLDYAASRGADLAIWPGEMVAAVGVGYPVGEGGEVRDGVGVADEVHVQLAGISPGLVCQRETAGRPGREDC